LRFPEYIAVSFVFHVFLCASLVFFRTETAPVTVPVFDVNIVGAVQEEEYLPEVYPLLPPLRPAKTGELKDSIKPPETLFDQGRESGASSPGQEETVKMAGPPGEEHGIPEEKEGNYLVPESSLFDKEIIKKYAGKGTSDEKDVTFDVPEFHHRGYMTMLKAKIEGIWKFPPEAARQGISGDLYIRFSINKDGSLGEVKLMRTSGHSDLDNAALKAVTDAEPFWPLPHDWKGDDLSITGHFIYIYGKYFIL
jgi:protein TonB